MRTWVTTIPSRTVTARHTSAPGLLVACADLPRTMQVDGLADASVLQRHDYPEPIVDHAAAISQAKRRIGAVRRQIRGDGSTRALLERHGSRRPPPARRRR